MKKVMAGIDLHSNNLMIGIMDMDGKRVASQKLSCGLKEVVGFLSPFKWNRLSPKQHAASQMDTQKTISFYGLGGVFQVRFLAVSDHRLLQHPHVVSGR